MLRDFRNGADLNLERELAAGRSTSGKLGVLLSKLFPPRRQIALSYPVAEQSWRVFLWYPVKWWHLASRRLPGFLRTRKTGTLSDHGRQLAKLGDWLQEAPDGRR